jgi:hypothetical protein
MGTSLHLIEYNKYQSITTHCLVKCTWEFLNKHNINLQHDISIPKNTSMDTLIMEEFCGQKPSLNELIALNQCRLYLNAYYVSDIATASGASISSHAWEGVARPNDRTNRYIWPEQGRPSKDSWNIWRHFLKRTILSRGMSLRKTLGS